MMSSPKILLISPSLDDKGGVAIFCRLLVKNISPGFLIEHFPIGNRPGNRNPMRRVFLFLRDAVKLRQETGRSDYSLVLLNPSFRILSLLRDSFFLALMKKPNGREIVVMFHGWDDVLVRRIARNPLLKSCFKRIYNKARLILVLCRAFQSQLAGMGVPLAKIRVVTTMYEKTQADGAGLESRPGEKTGVLFVGKLTKSKGVFIVAETAKLLVENGFRDFKVVIAGDGPEEDALKHYVREHGLENVLEIPGYVSGENKSALFGASTIFIFPSSSEGCPLAVLEAMGAGLAIVSRPVGAIPELVKDYENGLIIDGFDPKDFFRAARTLMEDRGLLARIQLTNKKFAEERFEAKVVTRRMESLFLSVMEQTVSPTRAANP